MEQLSMFDGMTEPGDWVETHGRRLTFDEVTERVGRLIVYDCSTESHAWYQAVRVERIITDEDGCRRAILYHGKPQRYLVSEFWFRHGKHPARAYELAN